MIYRRHKAALVSCASLSLIAVLVAGCGGVKTGDVSGKVTVDGQPVAGLEVSFEPNDASLGTTAIGYTQAGGEYELFYPGGETGIPAGEYTVRIVAGETDEPGPPVQIPVKYNAETDLIRVIEGGGNSFDFELTTQ